MRITLLILLISMTSGAVGQDTVVNLTPAMVNQYNFISLTNLDAWIFKKGTDPLWAKDNIDLKTWRPFKLSELTDKLVDKAGRLEGWLRIKIRLDTSFGETPLDISVYLWAATDLYLDGRLLYSYGNTGSNGGPYREYNPTYKLPMAFNADKGKEHLLALHIVDYLSVLPPFHLKSSTRFNDLIICMPRYKPGFFKWSRQNQTFKTIWISVNIILCCLFWLLALLNRREKNITLISITSTAFTITVVTDSYIPFPGLSFFNFRMFEIFWAVFLSISSVLIVVLLVRIFERRLTSLLKGLLALVIFCPPLIIFYSSQWALIFEIFLVNTIYGYYIVSSWRNLKGAQWAVLTGILLSMLLGFILAFTTPNGASFEFARFLYTGVFLSFPLSLLVYLSARFKEIIADVRKNAGQVVKLSEEKKEQALNQQKILQEEVNRQTAELRNTLENLRSTQAQLIQSEKMASLGELTAGIAHEIQNPLNFVNNFSDVNTELIDELKTELATGNTQSANEIADNLKENEKKINHHGKRAEAIVKGMLQHSRTGAGIKEPTDINKLTDEYLRLAYHGLRAKDKSFNARFETNFEENVGKINIIPQDIGRVLLNLINNAFYAVSAKASDLEKTSPDKLAAADSGYQPTVVVSTKKQRDKIEIKVADNGNGIRQKILDKIFQPFFTTKPTGQGTGLGLSLAYDIVKGHGGDINVKTKEGEGSEFIIQLPAV